MLLSVESRVTLASLLFGLGSWITITGFWQELPVLTDRLPEKWRLSSQLTLFIQAANVGPLIYAIGRYFKVCGEVAGSHISMIIGVISCFLLIFAWDQTVHILGDDRSLYVLVSSFGLSLLDCTSSVTFLVFMARFRERHLTPYLIGEGLSGFIPILVAMIQGSQEKEEKCLNGTMTIPDVDYHDDHDDDKLLFGPSIFFLSLLVTLLISWASFFWLLYSETAKKEHVHRELPVIQLQDMNGNRENGLKEVDLGDKDEWVLSDRHYWCLQMIMVYACLSTFGIFPGLQTYSARPYSGWCLHYSVIVTGLAYPVGASFALFGGIRSLKWTLNWTFLGSAISLYILVCAIMSPTPFLSSNEASWLGAEQAAWGGIIMVNAWFCYIGILSYVKTIVAVTVTKARGEEGLFFVGVFTQIGSVAGAAFVFIAVNHLHWFKDSCFE